MDADAAAYNRLSLAYSDTGAGDSPETLVLLHGFGGARSSWTPVLAELSVPCRSITVDLPGHGRSKQFDVRGYARKAALDVVALLDTLQIGQVHLCGFSLGGAVASLVALAQADRLRSLTLVAPGGFGREIASDMLSALASAEDEQAVAHALGAMAAPGAHIPEAEIRNTIEARSGAGTAERLKEIAGAIAHEGKQGVLPLGDLADPPYPASVVWGTEDPVLPFAHAANLPRGFRLVPISGAGHLLPIEASKTIAQLLDGVVGSRTSL